MAEENTDAKIRSITHKFLIGGHEGFIHVDFVMNEDRAMPRMVKINMAKEGSMIHGLMDSLSLAVSLALQHGVPLADICKEFIGKRFEPSGHTDNPEIPNAKSPTDYLFRWLEWRFLNGIGNHRS